MPNNPAPIQEDPPSGNRDLLNLPENVRSLNMVLASFKMPVNDRPVDKESEHGREVLRQREKVKTLERKRWSLYKAKCFIKNILARKQQMIAFSYGTATRRI